MGRRDFSRRPSDARFSVLRAGLLVGVWLLLWRDLSPGVWLGGAVVAGIVEAMRRVFLRPGQINPVGLAIFLVRYFLKSRHEFWACVFLTCKIFSQFPKPFLD